MSNSNTKRRKLKKQAQATQTPSERHHSRPPLADIVVAPALSGDRKLQDFQYIFPYVTHTYSDSLSLFSRLHPNLLNSPDVMRRQQEVKSTYLDLEGWTEDDRQRLATMYAMLAHIADWKSRNYQRHDCAGYKGLFCFRTACQQTDAWFYNMGSRHWYCLECAVLLNRENRPFWKNERTDIMCVAPTDIPKTYLAALSQVELRRYEDIVKGSPRY
jgi:hypothetical protein